MRPATRSTIGAMLTLAMIPFAIGLLACMPVPIGNPERSRIDPEISGVWLVTADADEALYAFEPWDKRTWVVTGASATDEDSVSIAVYKAWRSKHGGEWFMTWEPRINYDNADFQPELWLVFREEREDDGRLSLHMVNGEDDVFKGLDKTRRAYEKALRRNARNPDIYAEDPWIFEKATPAMVSQFYKNVDRVIDD